MEVCTAIMLFAELERQQSMAQRIIFYPKQWSEQTATQKPLDRTLETSLRLLRDAASRYKVMLQPIDPAAGATEGKLPRSHKCMSILTLHAVDPEMMYPISSLLSLTSFDRIIYLIPSGLIIDSTQLDLLFTLPMDTPVLAISATSHEENAETSLVILEPSKRAYDDFIEALPVESYSDVKFLQRAPAMTDFAEDQIHLVTRISTLRLAEESFSADNFLEATGYVHLSDAARPGPEYYLSGAMLSMARPSRSEARKAWETTYELFRERRMEFCGLDLEPLKPASPQTVANEG